MLNSLGIRAQERGGMRSFFSSAPDFEGGKGKAGATRKKELLRKEFPAGKGCGYLDDVSWTPTGAEWTLVSTVEGFTFTH